MGLELLQCCLEKLLEFSQILVSPTTQFSSLSCRLILFYFSEKLSKYSSYYPCTYDFITGSSKLELLVVGSQEVHCEVMVVWVLDSRILEDSTIVNALDSP